MYREVNEKIFISPALFFCISRCRKWRGLSAVFPLTDQSSASAFSDRLRSTLGEEESTTRHFGPINGRPDTGKIPSQFDSIKQEIGSVYFQSMCGIYLQLINRRTVWPRSQIV